jgi:ArsR family metal-binding transcriptional regulator
MLLKGYTKQIFRPECNPSFESVHCVATLNEDIGEVLPYLNAVLGGTQYFKDPPQVMFHHNGRIIKVGAREIAVNALADEAQAEKILGWLKNEINQAWENRESITPCFAGRARPQLMEILKMLPKTNCKKCGQATCMVFAVALREGAIGPDACPELDGEKLQKLEGYLNGFDLEA